jgi:hypothetical protein
MLDSVLVGMARPTDGRARDRERAELACNTITRSVSHLAFIASFLPLSLSLSLSLSFKYHQSTRSLRHTPFLPERRCLRPKMAVFGIYFISTNCVGNDIAGGRGRERERYLSSFTNGFMITANDGDSRGAKPLPSFRMQHSTSA